MKETAALRRRILSRRATLAVVGQGHAGLSLACAAADAGFRVTALDVDETRIKDLSRGVLSVPGVSELVFRAGLASERIEFSTELESIHESDLVSICFALPIRDQAPDFVFFEEVFQRVGRHLRPGHLVIVESAVFPGMMDDLGRPALEASGLSASHDFLLAHAPERGEPGNEEYGIQNTPRIVGGMTREATGVAALFYGQLTDKVVQVSSCRAAEMATLLENAFRLVNVALVNELALLCDEQGIDVWEVLEAAASKPFGYMPFRPGPGVGGYEVPVASPSSGGNEVDGFALGIVGLANSANSRMPEYVASRIQRLLSEAGKDLSGARILALGVTHKPNVGDILESPALKVLYILKERGARISYHDPYVTQVVLNGDMLSRRLLTEHLVEAADCVALLTPHKAYDLDWIARHAHLVFDAQNAYGPDRRSNVIRL